MFEVIGDVWKYITNRNERWSAKASIAIVIISFVFIFEMTTGLASGFINSQRIEQLERIENALVVPGIDDAAKIYLKGAKQELIRRGTVSTLTFSDVWSSFVSLILNTSSLTEKALNTKNEKEQPISTRSASRYVFFQLVSSSVVWILIGFLYFVDFFVQGV